MRLVITGHDEDGRSTVVSDEQVAGWFEAAGLGVSRVETLEGGELTVKLWLARRELGERKLKAVG